MFSVRSQTVPKPPKMFFKIINYFTSQRHYNPLYVNEGGGCRIIVEPHLIDIEKGKYYC